MQTALLYIDDDPEDLDLFCEAVNTVDPDIICFTADGGRKGINLLDGMTDLPSFIFLDLQMYELDGLATLQEIRKNTRYADIEIVVFSGAGNPLYFDQCRALGVKYFLSKESNFRLLCRGLGEILKLQK